MFTCRSQATITATTEPDGYVRLSYRAPEFGGSVDIIATAVVATDTIVNAFRLDVKVPDLIAIPDTIGDGLIGGTCNHHGPRDDSLHPNCRTPDDNHYVTQETLNKLGAIVSAWDPGHPNEPIKFNDGSLPNGGRFDECGEWSSCANHKFHRLGRDIDVRTQNAGFPPDSGIKLEEMKDVSGNLVLYRGKTILYNPDLDRVVVANGGRPKPEVHFRNHYHFYFY